MFFGKSVIRSWSVAIPMDESKMSADVLQTGFRRNKPAIDTIEGMINILLYINICRVVSMLFLKRSSNPMLRESGV